MDQIVYRPWDNNEPDWPTLPDPSPGSPQDRAKNPTGLTAQLVLCATIGTLCFLLFCLLRVRWNSMYAPRLRMKKHAPQRLPDTMFGWILPLIRIPHTEVLEKVGLDAVVVGYYIKSPLCAYFIIHTFPLQMLQFLLTGAKLFALCGFFGTAVLIPLNGMNGIANSTDPIHNDTMLFEPSEPTPPHHSNSVLWAYLFFTYFFCFAAFYFTFRNYRDYIRMRRKYGLQTATTLPARTVMVTGIPPELRSDRKLAEYFESLGLGVVESVHVVKHVSQLSELIRERARCLRRLELSYARYWGNPCNDPDYDPDELLMQAEQSDHINTIDFAPHQPERDRLPLFKPRRSRPTVRDGMLGITGKKVDAIEYYSEQFNYLDDIVIKARRLGRYPPSTVGFVTFESVISATIAVQTLLHPGPFLVRTQAAPEPRDILWNNVAIRGRERLIRKSFVYVMLLLIIFLWGVPIGFLSTFTNVESLERYLPWLVDLANKNKILQQIVYGFVPTLSVVIFMAILPVVFNFLSVIEGIQSRSEAEEATFSKYFFFQLWNVFFVFTVASTVFTLREIIEDPKQIPNVLATKLPQVAPFFVNYTIIQGMMLLPIQLLQIGPVIVQLFRRWFLCKTPRDYAEILAPTIVNLLYYVSSHLVYFHPYEVAGRAWPMVFSRIIVGLLIFEITSAGIFALKRAFELSALCAPLIIVTILFKIVMDSAYNRSSQVIPLQMLTQKFGSDQLQYAAALAAQQQNGELSPSAVEDPPERAPARRRTVLDDDDYEAEPVEQTDFKEPPMTLFDGILNTGMKRFGHPAIVGVLPQLWLPVKGGHQLQRRRSRYIRPSLSTASLRIKRSSSRAVAQNGNGDQVGQEFAQTEYQEEPQDMEADERSGLLSNGETAVQVEDEANTSENTRDDSDYDTEEDGINATYYHHPERRRSRTDILATTDNISTTPT
ncbi:hypothetical protein INT44_004871 [Umbelopsis vinacea]|uniref:DUF221-domain-containing protein n=1 Tax=Umbelopsis vinacea TaxID=44442 RepID=A0A8H7Q644_9FUNG|nr:hypothetical protein INT44_004871 [Umbelopsis vinacea]